MGIKFGPLLGGGFYNDATAGAGAYTDEEARDAVSAMLTDSASVDFTVDDIANTITAVVLPAGVDHDALANFVANEHIDHSAVSITAGTGLTGGGTIAANRTLAIDVTGVAAATYGSSTTSATFAVNTQGQITSASNTNIDHDAITNFVANEHIDHSAVSVTAGAGLTGGGTIAATRTLDVSFGTGPAAICTQANGVSNDVARIDHVHATPMTNTGDIMYYSGGTVARLALGTANKVLVSNGTTLVYDYPLILPSTIRELKDDFMSATTNSTQALGWLATNSGAGAAVAASTATAGSLGIASPSTGTTTTGRSSLSLNLNSLYCSQGAMSISWRMKMPTQPDATEDFFLTVGCGDFLPSGEHFDGPYFYYDRNSAFVLCKTASLGVRTSTTSTFTMDLNWNTYSIVVNAAGTSVEFYINGTLYATHTTNLNSNTGRVAGPVAKIEKIAGTTARQIDLDWFYFRGEF